MKIIMSDNDHVDQDIEREILQSVDKTFEVKQCKTEEDVIKNCRGATIILNEYAPMTRKVFQALEPDLKLVVRYGVGVNNIDLEAAAEFGVQVCNVPDYGMNEVAEHALALTLDLCRKVSQMNKSVRHGRWTYRESIPIFRLSEQTLGIAGMGRNGKAYAHKASGIFGKFMGYSPHFRPSREDATDFIEAVDFDTLLAEADVIALHMPLTPQTHHIINRDTLGKMKKTAFLVNVSRGGLVNENDLEDALASGAIAGAALDVTEKEPISPYSPLLRHENCLITPHMAWYSVEAEAELKRKVAEEAVRFIKGEKPLNPVNTPK